LGTVIVHHYAGVLAVRLFMEWKTSYDTYAAWNGRSSYEKKRRVASLAWVNYHHNRMERLKKRYPQLQGSFNTFDL
jgi:uncharacterized protein YbcC (UPF0753/DUF2309 family)